MTVIERLRSGLKPVGSSAAVPLQMYEQAFTSDFVNACLAEIEAFESRVALGATLTHLEKLAYVLLLENCGMSLRDVEAERYRNACLEFEACETMNVCR